MLGQRVLTPFPPPGDPGPGDPRFTPRNQKKTGKSSTTRGALPIPRPRHHPHHTEVGRADGDRGETFFLTGRVERGEGDVLHRGKGRKVGVGWARVWGVRVGGKHLHQHGCQKRTIRTSVSTHLP